MPKKSDHYVYIITAQNYTEPKLPYLRIFDDYFTALQTYHQYVKDYKNYVKGDHQTGDEMGKGEERTTIFANKDDDLTTIIFLIKRRIE